jgi:hypothetical protein
MLTRWQSKSEKIRFDLYNRRFEIFSNIFSLYEAMVFWEGNGTAEQISPRLLHALLPGPCGRSDATTASRFVRAEDNPEIDSREDLRHGHDP